MWLGEALRESEGEARLLADVVQKAAVPFGMGAPDGRLVLFNEAFEELTGYSHAELEKKALTWSADLTPPEWRGTEAAILAGAVSERRSVRYEKEYLRKDGSRVPIELFVQPIFDESGTLLHYRSFLTDISDRKQAEQSLLERETEAARLDQILPGSRTTRLVGRFGGHRWRVLVGAVVIQSAILGALNTVHNSRHVLGLPGSMIALISVIAGALAGPLVGALVAVAGGGRVLPDGGRPGQSIRPDNDPFLDGDLGGGRSSLGLSSQVPERAGRAPTRSCGCTRARRRRSRGPTRRASARRRACWAAPASNRAAAGGRRGAVGPT